MFVDGRRRSMVHKWSQGRFRILLVITALTGMTQGLLIPLLTTLLEQRGVSSSINGLNAAVMYLGMLLTAPLVGPVVRRVGYNRAILTGSRSEERRVGKAGRSRQA